MLKKITLEEKIIVRINKSHSNAFISSDFFDLSDRNQISRALRKLVQNGFIIKLGQGVFAKTKQSPFSEKRILVASFSDIVKEALIKLNIKIQPSQAEKDYNLGMSEQVPTGLVIAVKKRVDRKFTYNGKTIKFELIL